MQGQVGQGRETLCPPSEALHLLEELRKKPTFNLVDDKFVHPGSILQSIILLFIWKSFLFNPKGNIFSFLTKIKVLEERLLVFTQRSLGNSFHI